MKLLFYNLFLKLYKLGVYIVAIFSNKAKLWISGRKNIFKQIEIWKSSISKSEKIIWIHCASLGEFEQGRPIIENIKKNFPYYKLVLTFFSPSGYEIRKNYSGVDAVFYLPLDSKNNATRFIEIIKPTFVIWVKYEYWYYYLTTLKNNNIPVFLISAVFRNTQPFFKIYGSFWKKMLYSFDTIFIQNEASLELLQSIGFKENVILAGDTRFDRVLEIATNSNTIPKEIIDFCENKTVILAGSTWLEDEEELVHYAKVNPQIKFIIAPHEIDAERLIEIQKLFKNTVLFSELNKTNNHNQTLIINNIGLLAQLYKISNIAYIGGGFNSSGIHNILEAAVYGKPIIFGPIYQKFAEAVDLVDLKGAFSINNALELESLINKLISNTDFYENASKTNQQFVISQKGATDIIIRTLYEKRLLTKE